MNRLIQIANEIVAVLNVLLFLYGSIEFSRFEAAELLPTVGGYIAPDYRGALTGSYSTDISFKVNIDGVDYLCSLYKPIMHRDSVDSPWQLDSSEDTFLRNCGKTIKQNLLTAMKRKNEETNSDY
ncbi:MAG: hypothetical protein HC862_02995 [Scytonema sp. RU_4_4]|nr:hypothetical protein [Scytonema sp. RU_4_4]